MDKKLNKIFDRLILVSGYAIYQFLAIIGQFVMSYLVIKYHSKTLWGEVVEYLIVINLATLFCMWGQNTYLVRSMSQNISKIGFLWQESLMTRSVLLGFVLVGIVVFYSSDLNLAFYISLWLIFNYLHHSIDPIHLFIRTFKFPIFVEVLSLLVFAIFFIWNKNHLTALLIVQFYVLQSFVKAIGSLLSYRKILFNTSNWQFNIHFFRAAFPFFLPGFIGFIQNRMDLYGIAYYLPEKTLGAYQVFLGIMTIFMLGARVVINPFLKVIYRLPFSSLMKLNRLFFIRSLLALTPCLSATYFLLPFIYEINFEPQIYIATYCMIVALWSYIILTHILIRYQKENQLVGVFLMGAIFNLLGNYFFIPDYGVLGAVGVMAVVQWGMWACFMFLVKNILSKKQKAFV